jgi:hypothetical protein
VKWKRFFLDNLGTKLMALVLAMLLWIYLYNESTDAGEFDAAFFPKIEDTNLATWQFLNENGDPIQGSIKIKITGPKGDLGGLSRKGIRCEPRFEKNLFEKEPVATIQRDLTPNDLNLPEGFRIVFKPSARIQLKYVRFTEKRVKVKLPEKAWDGKPANDFTVRDVRITSPVDHMVTVRLRADVAKDIEELPLRPVSLTGGPSENLYVSGRLATSDESIQLRTEVRLEVRIELETDHRLYDLPLWTAGDTAVTGRVELLTRTIQVKVVGPKSSVQKLEPKSLFAFVVVTEPELSGRKMGEKAQLRQIHCQVLDEAARKDLKVVVMPDVKDEDRLVDVKVIKE